MHLLLLMFVSALVGLVFGVTMKQTWRERLLYAAKIFFSMVGFALVAGWISYFLPWW